MVITKEIENKWCPSNKKHFESLGYKFTYFGDSFIAKFEDMPHSSDKYIDVQCDYCKSPNGIFKKQIKKYYQGRTIIEKDCCKNCRKHKSYEAKKLKYGTVSAYVNGNTVEKHKQRYKDTIGKEIFQKIKEIFKERDYTLLSDEYVNNHTPIYYICNKHSQYGKQSITWIHLKSGEKCRYCAFEDRSGENNNKWNGGTSSINSFLRSETKQWVYDSLKASNYKCDISNEGGYLEVHHLYKNFKDIVTETFEITMLEEKQKIGDYSREELKLLSNICLKLHYDYGLGVCLKKDYHRKFHSYYGYFNNTPEQYYKFKKEIQAELFVENQDNDSLLLCSNE